MARIFRDTGHLLSKLDVERLIAGMVFYVCAHQCRAPADTLARRNVCQPCGCGCDVRMRRHGDPLGGLSARTQTLPYYHDTTAGHEHTVVLEPCVQ